MSGPAFNPAAPVNNSPNNTGAMNSAARAAGVDLVPVRAPAPNSRSSAPAVGLRWRGRSTISIPTLASDIKLPEYFDDTLIMYEWSRNWFWEVKLDQNGAGAQDQPVVLGRFRSLGRWMWSSDRMARCTCWNGARGFGGGNADAKLVRVEFLGNLPTLTGDYNQDNVVDAADYVVWRKTVDSTTDFRADGNGDGVIDAGDYDVWRANFGATLASPGTASAMAAATDSEALGKSPVDTSSEPNSASVARGIALETPLSRKDAAVEKAVRNNQRPSAESDGNDLLLLATDKIRSPWRHHSLVSEHGRNNHREDDDDNGSLVDEALSAVLSAWI